MKVIEHRIESKILLLVMIMSLEGDSDKLSTIL
jgi:hypothetical protein